MKDGNLTPGGAGRMALVQHPDTPDLIGGRLGTNGLIFIYITKNDLMKGSEREQ